jgi:hypothetical protein
MRYWLVCLGLIGFGFVAVLSIGRPFLMVGLAMLLLWPVRHRAAFFWPPISAVIAWNVGFFAIAPFSCTATQAIGVGSASSNDSVTVCTSLTGITYSGGGVFNPSLQPASDLGLLVAVVTAGAVLAIVLWAGRARQGGS